MSNENEREGGARIQLSGLWKQQSRTGKAYYSGSLGGVQLQLWPNKFKEAEDRRPDLILYLVKREPKKKEELPAKDDPANDDEVPF